MRIKLLVISGLLLCALQNSAQIQNAAKPLKWDLKFSGGFSVDSPTRKDFFNVGLPYWSVSDFHNHLPWNFEFKRSLHNNLSAGININRRGFEGTFFTVAHKFNSTGISPVLLYNLKDMFFIGGGPSVYAVRQKSFYNQSSKLVYKMLKVGFESELSFKFPLNSKFYTQIDASYCYAGKNKVFEFMDVQSGLNVEPLFYYARNISLSYIYFGIGMGYRL